MLCLGIDVGVRKGLDLVLMDGTLSIRDTRRRVRLDEVGAVLGDLRPDVVAIDSPPWWAGSGNRSRATERQLATLLIRCFATPSEELGTPNRFYHWMRVGFEVFRTAADLGYPTYAGGPVAGTAIEVFPHASAVVLSGTLPPPGASRAARMKRDWRAAVLASRGIDASMLSSIDQVDAALAALTGILALRGQFVLPGDPTEGVIVLPVPSLPPHPYRPAHQEVATT